MERGRVLCVLLHRGERAVALSCTFDDLNRAGLVPGRRGVVRFAGAPARPIYLERVDRSRLALGDLVPLSRAETARLRLLEKKRDRALGAAFLAGRASAGGRLADAEAARLAEEIETFAWSPERLAHAALLAQPIHHWEAESEIVLATVLTPDFTARPLHLEAAAGSDVVVEPE